MGVAWVRGRLSFVGGVAWVRGNFLLLGVWPGYEADFQLLGVWPGYKTSCRDELIRSHDVMWIVSLWKWWCNVNLFACKRGGIYVDDDVMWIIGCTHLQAGRATPFTERRSELTAEERGRDKVRTKNNTDQRWLGELIPFPTFLMLEIMCLETEPTWTHAETILQ